VATLACDIRQATLEDLSVTAVLFDLYRQYYGQRSDVPRALVFLAERMANGESVILLAVDPAAPRGGALGFAQLYPSFSSVATRRVWILNDLYVAPRARRRGVATQLLAAAREHAERTGAAWIELTTRHDNAGARRVYESAEYREDHDFVTYRWCR